MFVLTGLFKVDGDEDGVEVEVDVVIVGVNFVDFALSFGIICSDGFTSPAELMIIFLFSKVDADDELELVSFELWSMLLFGCVISLEFALISVLELEVIGAELDFEVTFDVFLFCCCARD